MEAPNSGAYIGDDRENNVKNATTDLFSGRPVRSSYYLSLMFDKVAAELFHKNRGIGENGPIGGNLSWLSKNGTTSNVSFQYINDDISTKYNFREGSILNITQQILDSKPQNGGDALAHIGHVLDQTSKYFKDGDRLISRGSGVRYIDNSGKDIGVEYARVWTKDRPYFSYGDTMPLWKESVDKPYYNGAKGGTGDTTNSKSNFYRRTGIRRFDGSVMTNTWNLNMAPMSDGTTNPEFPGSSNIVPNPKGNGFYAKKYMLSIENLAWGASTLQGYTVNDLPYSERGPNGGRVMWFPPYDLKVSEQNSAKWEPNTFLGRPEPIYTYQNTERTGQLSFKVIVDHPSIMNLLIREHFKSVNDEDVDKFLNAFFAGAKDIDFYSLIRQYSHLDSDDIKMIQNYLGQGGSPDDIKRRLNPINSVVENNPGGTTALDANKDKVKLTVILPFQNDDPGPNNSIKSPYSYSAVINRFKDEQSKLVNKNKLRKALEKIITGTTEENKIDCKLIFLTNDIPSDQTGNTINKKIDQFETVFTDAVTSYEKLKNVISNLKLDLDKKNIYNDVVINVSSHTSNVGETKQNYVLSMRRSHSLFLLIFENIKKEGIKIDLNKWTFINPTSQITASGNEMFIIETEYTFSELGYEGDRKVIFRSYNHGSKNNTINRDCNHTGYFENDLIYYNPLSYGCRASEFIIQYDKNKKEDKPSNGSVNTILGPTGNIPSDKTKPPIDVMKRIIMKTLSEEYYFKKLEEDSPMIYTSLKQKLKYFHPAFHSMTPEGLNSRLTFLHQCLRPGNTIPIKGLSDDSDINARNTTFGPPPVCVLRVGDFYNSKIIIKDLNIQFEQNVWDLNPEGIGVQPMIADVTLQITFLGGHGLEKPIERLQNALSSNFFANTEMYDERSESTNTKMGGKDSTEFTKEFIQSLNNTLIPITGLKDSNRKSFIEGQYIGTINNSDKTLDYTTLVNDVYSSVEPYFTSYEKMYNSLSELYGHKITNLMVNKSKRVNNKYDVFSTSGNTTSNQILLFGNFKETEPISKSIDLLILRFQKYFEFNIIKQNYGILKLLNIDNIVTDNLKDFYNEGLYDHFYEYFDEKVIGISTSKVVKDYEEIRNKLIKSLDKLNTVIKYNSDFKIDKNKVYKLTITGNTSEMYNQYESCIDFIKNNENKMYKKLDTSLDDAITDNIISDIIYSVFNNDYKNALDSIELQFDVEDEENSKIADKIRKKLDRNFYKTKSINMGFGKAPKLKNSNKISFGYTDEILDSNDDVIKLYSSKYKPTDDKLNYYK
jgi:outer membrane protein OmpA-like peptidoglycan-associated protein